MALLLQLFQRAFPHINVESVGKHSFMKRVLQFVLEEMEEEPISPKGMSTYDLTLLIATKYYGKLTNTPEQPLFQTPAAAWKALRGVSPISE